MRRIESETSEIEIKDHIQTITNSDEIECKKMNTKSKYGCFKIGVNLEYKEKVMNPTYWPKGTLISPFFFYPDKLSEGQKNANNN